MFAPPLHSDKSAGHYYKYIILATRQKVNIFFHILQYFHFRTFIIENSLYFKVFKGLLLVAGNRFYLVEIAFLFLLCHVECFLSAPIILSIVDSSLVVKVKLSRAARFSFNWAALLTPMITLVTES